MRASPVALLWLACCTAHARGTEQAPLAAWRVSAGKLELGPDATLLIADGSVRAELSRRADTATLEFIYRGPVAHPEPLASGELRRQIGMKLRAHDTCNVVYVMWHLEPRPGIEVAVKSNPGLHAHADCGDHGYTFVAPQHASPVASIIPDTWHTLSATLHGPTLEVSADGALAWQGRLPSAAFTFDGPVGLRSDNGRFRFRFK